MSLATACLFWSGEVLRAAISISSALSKLLSIWRDCTSGETGPALQWAYRDYHARRKPLQLLPANVLWPGYAALGERLSREPTPGENNSPPAINPRDKRENGL